MNINESIPELLERMRNTVNSSLLRYEILTKDNLWYQLCSSMDCLEDTQLAIKYFVESDFPDAVGDKFVFIYGGQYIYIYGLLQALFLQQDALKDFSEIISYEINFKKEYSELYEIREIRNKTSGHPTKRDYKGKWKSTHSIVRTSMSKKGFELRSKYKKEDANYEKIDIIKLINIQDKNVKFIINALIKQIKLRDEEIKMEFKDDKLISLFDNCLLGNYFSYMLEYSNGDSASKSMADMGFKMIKEIIDKFQQMYKERYHSDEFTNFDIYKLLKIFNNWKDNKIKLNNDVLYFLTKQLKLEFFELKETAKDIDNEFLIE